MRLPRCYQIVTKKRGPLICFRRYEARGEFKDGRASMPRVRLVRADVQLAIISTTKTTTKDRASSNPPRAPPPPPKFRPQIDSLQSYPRPYIHGSPHTHQTAFTTPRPVLLLSPRLKLLPDSEDKDKNEDSTSTCHSSSIDHAVKENGLSVKSGSLSTLLPTLTRPLATTRKRCAWRAKKPGK